MVCLGCRYHNINQLKGPVCMNIISFLNEVFYGVLPSMCAVNSFGAIGYFRELSPAIFFAP